jgi:hypothetical protein
LLGELWHRLWALVGGKKVKSMLSKELEPYLYGACEFEIKRQDTKLNETG